MLGLFSVFVFRFYVFTDNYQNDILFSFDFQYLGSSVNEMVKTL